ncbi:MAG: hypothetical protein J6D31_03310 [Clostridia bacterium]|nr:hypothetical protein [Clostridia bacterium]
MKKRILSLLLVACILLPCLPLAAFPALASEESQASEAEPVTVTFQMADGRVVCQRQQLPGYAWITSPSEAELSAAGVTADEQAEIIGWYYMAPDGKYYDLGAYNSIRLEQDLIITPFTKTSKISVTKGDESKNVGVPLYDADTNTLLAWQSGFTMGYVAKANPLGEMKLYDRMGGSGERYVQYTDLWTYGGLYMRSGNNYGFILTNNDTASANYRANTTAIAWTALVSGTIDISLDINSVGCILLVAKNDKVIYPTSGVDLSDQMTWYVKATDSAACQLTVAEDLAVTAGDEIRFVLVRHTDNKNSQGAIWPTITYTNDLSAPEFSDEIVKNLTTAFDSNKPTFDTETGKATFHGNWQLVHYASKDAIAAGNADLMDTGTHIQGGENNTNALTVSSQASSTAINAQALALMLAHKEWGNGTEANSFAIAVRDGAVAGYRYTAEKAGLIDIDFTKLGRYGKMGVAAATVSYAIYVDGVQVWPKGDWYPLGELTASQQKIVTDAANATDVDARRGIPVKEGSRVEILCTNPDSSIYSGSGQLMYADLRYTEAYDGVTSFDANMPSYEKTDDIFSANGGWDLVYYDSLADLVNGTVQFCHSGMSLNGERNALSIASNAGKGIGNVNVAFNVHRDNDNYWGDASNSPAVAGYALAIANSKIAGYRYTAEMTGLVNIDFTKLGRFGKSDSTAATNISYAIYVDGVQVWPAGEDWYALGELTASQQKIVTDAANATDVEARRNIFVREGSRVEILCTNTGKSVYSGAGQLMYANVYYTEVDPQLAVYGTVGSAFALNVEVGNTFSYADIAVKMNGKTLSLVDGAYTMDGIAAKEIDQPVAYEVSGSINGKAVTLAKGEMSFADYLDALKRSETLEDDVRSLAEATLQYGAAAKLYFAGGALNEEERAVIETKPETTGTASFTKNQTANKFSFTGATLLLNDEIDIKLLIEANEAQASVAGYTLRVESEHEAIKGEGWQLEVREGADGMCFKAIITGIPAKAYGVDLKITVMEGNTAVSDTLTYSVDAYISRMYEQSNDAAKYLLHKIANLGDAATGELHVHSFGEWVLQETGEGGYYETRSCYGCAHAETRGIKEVSISYQDFYTLDAREAEILSQTVSSTDPLTGEMDKAVIRLGEDGVLEAVGVGYAMIKTESGHYQINVSPATINMLFLSGQSNAEGAHASTAPVVSSDYGAYFKRSPDRMAYYTYTYHGLDVTDAESTGRTPASFVVKTLQWGNETRYSSYKNGPASTTLCDESSTFGSAGIGGALAAEWINQTGERVWLVNAAHGGHPIQNFMPSDYANDPDMNIEVPEERYNDYEQAVAVFNLAMLTMRNEVEAGHFVLNHMVFYWLQGESDSSTNDLYYIEQFDRVYNSLQEDVYFEKDEFGFKGIDFGGLIAVRSCKDNSGNSLAELYMTGPRLAQYEIAASTDSRFYDVHFVSNATESWTGSDENVVNYFLSRYGSAENFKAIFGYDMPTTRAQLHPDIHYAIYGYNEIGTDAARNTLMILNEMGVADYELDYADLTAETDIRLVGMDGYSPLEKISIEASTNIGYVIPMVTPLYRTAEGITLVSETEGYIFEDFRLGVDKSYTGTLPGEVTFSVYLGTADEYGTWLQRYTMPVEIVASLARGTEVQYALYGGDLAENPDREYRVYFSCDDWQRGWMSYETGRFTRFDYFNSSNSWWYTTGDTLWGSGSTFHGAYNAGQGFGLSGDSGSSAAIRYRATMDGVVRPYFESLSSAKHDFDMAIAVNGYIVWPATANKVNYTDHGGWFHYYSGKNTDGTVNAAETATTLAAVNAALADCYLRVKEGDEVMFLLERVDGASNTVAMPVLQFVTGEVQNAITVPDTAYQKPTTTIFSTTGYDPASEATPWNFGFLTYSTNVFERFTVVDSDGWLHQTGETKWGTWHGGFHATNSYALGTSKKAGEDIAIRYTAEKAGIIVPQLASLTMSGGDLDLAIYVKRNGVYESVWPQNAAVVDGFAAGWERLYDGSKETETKTTAAAVNAKLAGISINVNKGDEILFVLGCVDNVQGTTIKLYPAIYYIATAEEETNA